MINYGKQFIDKKDIKEVTKVLKSNFLTQGPYVLKFEKALSKFLGYKYATVVSSGTAALHLVGKVLGWKKNDNIITTPISFLATSNSIVYAGANPVFVDIDEKFYSLDPIKVEKEIINFKKKGKKIKAIVCTDYAGHPANWSKIKKIAVKYNIKTINDNCHAIGAKINQSFKYTSKYCDFVTLSFHPVKNITSGEGGAILTNDRKYDKHLKTLRSHGVIRENFTEIWKYKMKELGFNYRLSDINCALGFSQLKKIKKFTNKRKSLAKFYDESFKNINGIKIPLVKEKYEHAYHLYPLRIDFKKFKITKKTFFKKMKKNNILLQVHYIPIYSQPFYKKEYRYKKNAFPISEKFYAEEISLPIYYSLKKKEQLKVIKTIKMILKINN